MIQQFIINSLLFIFFKLSFFILLLLLTILTQKIVSFILAKAFHKSSVYLKVDETNYRFFNHFVSALIYLIGIGMAVYSIPSLRTLSISLFAGAGVIAIIIGFASQHAFANIVSGVFITIFKPFRVGDRITIGTLRGIVEDINLRHTVIRDFENKRIIVPNSIISNDKIENSTISDPKICKIIDFSVSYDSSLDKAIQIIQEEAMNHKDVFDNRTSEEKKNGEVIVRVRVVGFADSSISLRAWVWAKDSATGFAMSCDIMKSVKERFDKEGIEIPYPYRTIVYKKDLPKKLPRKIK